MVADHNTNEEAANLVNTALEEFGMVANCIAILPAPSKIAKCYVAPTFTRYLGCLGSFFGLEMILSPISSGAHVFCSISHFAILVGTPDFA